MRVPVLTCAHVALRQVALEQLLQSGQWQIVRRVGELGGRQRRMALVSKSQQQLSDVGAASASAHHQLHS